MISKVLVITTNYSDKYEFTREIIDYLLPLFPNKSKLEDINHQYFLRKCVGRHMSICKNKLIYYFKAIYDALSEFIEKSENNDKIPIDIYYIKDVFNVLATLGEEATQSDIDILDYVYDDYLRQIHISFTK